MNVRNAVDGPVGRVDDAPVARVGGPVVASTRRELDEALSAGRAAGPARVGLVPTMGALHDGHASLLDEAGRRADLVVASVFVNPLQFGPSEDLSRYPRTLGEDVALCARHGVDIVFAPGVEEIYPDGEPSITVHPGPLGEILEGAVRPGHFRGVLTIVLKLLCLVHADVAVFGEKDYQQLVLVRRMVQDLSLSVDIVGAPTVRQPDGLALSSRNRYLTAEQQSAALALSRALKAALAVGQQGPAGVLSAVGKALAQEPAVAVDYVALRSPDFSADAAAGDARLLVAAKVGAIRLIDNVTVHLG